MKTVVLSHPDLPVPAAITLTPLSHDGDAVFNVTLAGATQEVHVQRSGGGAGVLRMGSAVYPYYAARRDNRLRLWIDGRSFVFDVAGDARRAGPVAAAGVLADLAAPMPGTVRAIRVAAGDVFAAHDPLVILESMKMEMTLSAPAGGRVAEVRCAVGDLVEMGAMLLKLEGERDAE